MPPSRRPHHAMLAEIARHDHDFMLEFKYSFYFFHDFAFCSFTLWIYHQLFSLPSHSFVTCKVFCFPYGFYNGGKLSDLYSVPRSQHVYSLDLHRILFFLSSSLSFGLAQYFISMPCILHIKLSSGVCWYKSVESVISAWLHRKLLLSELFEIVA